MALETMLFFLFCSACLEERTLSLGLEWQGRKETALLPFADPQYPLPFFAWSVCLSLGIFPVSVRMPSLLVAGTPTLFLFRPLMSVCLHLSVPALALPLVSGLSIHLYASLPRMHGGRIKRLSPGLRWRTLSLLLLTQPYE